MKRQIGKFINRPIYCLWDMTDKRWVTYHKPDGQPAAIRHWTTHRKAMSMRGPLHHLPLVADRKNPYCGHTLVIKRLLVLPRQNNSKKGIPKGYKFKRDAHRWFIWDDRKLKYVYVTEHGKTKRSYITEGRARNAVTRMGSAGRYVVVGHEKWREGDAASALERDVSQRSRELAAKAGVELADKVFAKKKAVRVTDKYPQKAMLLAENDALRAEIERLKALVPKPKTAVYWLNVYYSKSRVDFKVVTYNDEFGANDAAKIDERDKDIQYVLVAARFEVET